MKSLPHPFRLPRRSVQFILAAAIAPLALAQNPAPAPEVKVDSAQLPPAAGRVTTFAPIVEKVAPSVVTIATSKAVRRAPAGRNPYFNDPMFRRFFGLPEPDEEEEPAPQRRGGNNGGNEKKKLERSGLGSGVIVAPEGYILTNNHVIEGADEIIVTRDKDKQEYKAKKVGTDPATDLAVLKIEAKGSLPSITFADSSKVRVGDLVLAVGNPFGLTQTVTMGIVSALGRTGIEMPRTPGETRYEDFIQTDASINPGNSGGALVDAEGRLIGINTAIFSRTGGNLGIGFAVPANLAHNVMDSLIKNGKVSRGFLGIGLQQITDDLAKQFNLPNTDGALVTEVQPKSPAQKAGILEGDVVIEVNGKKVEGPRELQMAVAAIPPDTKTNVKVWRDGAEKALTVTLAERPNNTAAANTPDSNKVEDPDVLDGVTVGDIDAESRRQFEIPESLQHGVVITKVDPESPSAEAGIRVGDVVLEINRQQVKNAKQAVELSEKLKKEKKVLLRVASKGSSRYVVVERKE